MLKKIVNCVLLYTYICDNSKTYGGHSFLSICNLAFSTAGLSDQRADSESLWFLYIMIYILSATAATSIHSGI